MKFKKFVLVDATNRQTQPQDENTFTMLINIDHIISIKPIRMMHRETLLQGYWIRTSNGKKYRAIQIPTELKLALESNATELTPLQSLTVPDENVIQ